MTKLKKISAAISTVPAWLIAVDAAAAIAMNLLANKSIDLPYGWLALDCGILVSWVAFLIMDIITKCYGTKSSVSVSVLASAVNIAFVSVLYIASKVDGTWGESYAAANPALINDAIDATIAGNAFVLFGSTVATLSAALVNSILNEAIGRTSDNDKYTGFLLRSSVSTMVGQIADNLIFALIVSHTLFGWTIVQCVTCSVTGAVVELICEFIALPAGYKIAKTLEKKGITNAERERPKQPEKFNPESA